MGYWLLRQLIWRLCAVYMQRLACENMVVNPFGQNTAMSWRCGCWLAAWLRWRRSMTSESEFYSATAQTITYESTPRLDMVVKKETKASKTQVTSSIALVAVSYTH